MEAHGTGTVTGDCTEMKSISNVFCKTPTRKSRLIVGSVKSNIGHLESASGLAGLIKTILCLEKGIIPPSINLKEPKVGLQDELQYIRVSETFPAITSYETNDQINIPDSSLSQFVPLQQNWISHSLRQQLRLWR